MHDGEHTNRSLPHREENAVRKLAQSSSAEAAADDRSRCRVLRDAIESGRDVAEETAPEVDPSGLVEVEGLGDLLDGLPKDYDSV
jgi:hypothetical protein